MPSASPPISVQALAPGERDQWQALVAASPNATLFHDLDFLAYHPPGRFSFQHLLLRQGETHLAALPGGLVETPEGRVFVSPLGGSAGGPALIPSARLPQVLGMVQALQAHARDQAWAGLDITLPQTVLGHPPQEMVPFALFARGFRLVHRWLCAMLDLESAPAPRYAGLFRKRQAAYVRAAQRKGMTLHEGGVELLPGFLEVFDDTYARHGVRATHSPAEIEYLLTHLTDRVRIFLAMLDGLCTAGVLVFNVTPRVAYTFYICASTARALERGNLFLFAELADRLAERGIRWLDLGPASWDGNFNAGVTYFKESLGCLSHCRNRWSWRTGWTSGPALANRDFLAVGCGRD